MKKFISIILAGVLAASVCAVFAGCGGSKGSEMPTASTTVAPTTKPAATVPTTRSAANNNINGAVNNNAADNNAQASQVQDYQNGQQSEQQSSQTSQNQNQNPNNQSSYENSAPGGGAAIQGEQDAIFAALDYSGDDKVVDSQIHVDNGADPYYKITTENFDTGETNTYYVYGDGSVIPEGD